VGSHETANALGFLVRHPHEAWERTRSKVEHMADRRKQGDQRTAYEPDPHADRKLHDQIGVPFPCDASEEFKRMWGGLEESFAESSSFVGEWVHDADPGLAQITWCLVRHLRPAHIVETGVARGITSRVLLEALDANGEGQLWSIDLPFLRSQWHDQTAAAVPSSKRSRWTYVRGSSRRRLPPLLAQLGQIDIFIHDSAHTESNMLFEFETAWPAIRPGGVLVSHDITMNGAFRTFTDRVPGDPIFAQYEGGGSVVGVLVKTG